MGMGKARGWGRCTVGDSRDIVLVTLARSLGWTERESFTCDSFRFRTTGKGRVRLREETDEEKLGNCKGIGRIRKRKTNGYGRSAKPSDSSKSMSVLQNDVHERRTFEVRLTASWNIRSP